MGGGRHDSITEEYTDAGHGADALRALLLAELLDALDPRELLHVGRRLLVCSRLLTADCRAGVIVDERLRRSIGQYSRAVEAFARRNNVI
jgi:hypothetical protein